MKSSAAASVTATAARASTAGGPAKKHRSKTAGERDAGERRDDRVARRQRLLRLVGRLDRAAHLQLGLGGSSGGVAAVGGLAPLGRPRSATACSVGARGRTASSALAASCSRQVGKRLARLDELATLGRSPAVGAGLIARALRRASQRGGADGLGPVPRRAIQDDSSSRSRKS